MSAQPTNFPDLESISRAALEAAQTATTAAERATAAATAAAERATAIGLTLPPELLEQIGKVAGDAAATATETRLREIGALRDLGEETPPPAAAAGAGGEEPPGDGTQPVAVPPVAVPDPIPTEVKKANWASRFLGE